MFVALSPALVSLLTRMMHPDPKQRPTIDQLLKESSVRWATVKARLTCVWWVLVTGVRAVFRVILALITLLANLFQGEVAFFSQILSLVHNMMLELA